MKTLGNLKNPDIISINGEKYQVLRQIDLWQHPETKELDKCVELSKFDEPHISPMYRLVYVLERPLAVTFHAYDAKTDRFIETSLDLLEL